MKVTGETQSSKSDIVDLIWEQKPDKTQRENNIKLTTEFNQIQSTITTPRENNTKNKILNKQNNQSVEYDMLTNKKQIVEPPNQKLKQTGNLIPSSPFHKHTIKSKTDNDNKSIVSDNTLT